MLLKEYLMSIFLNYSKEDIKKNYIKLFNEEENLVLDKINYLYNKVKTPQKNDIENFKKIVFKEMKLGDVPSYFCLDDDEKEELTVDISLLDYDNKLYGIDFVSLERMLFSEVEISLNTFTDLDALCFYMKDYFFYGIEDSAREEVLESILKTSDEIASGKQKTYSFEEILEHLGLSKDDLNTD